MLLRKNSFTWFDQVEMAFNALKVAVTRPPVLRLAYFYLEFIFECDALGVGLGVVLMQKELAIAFFSKVLKRRALLLSTYKNNFLLWLVQ